MLSKNLRISDDKKQTQQYFLNINFKTHALNIRTQKG